MTACQASQSRLLSKVQQVSAKGAEAATLAAAAQGRWRRQADASKGKASKIGESGERGRAAVEAGGRKGRPSGRRQLESPWPRRKRRQTAGRRWWRRRRGGGRNVESSRRQLALPCSPAAAAAATAAQSLFRPHLHVTPPPPPTAFLTSRPPLRGPHFTPLEGGGVISWGTNTQCINLGICNNVMGI